MEKLETQIRPNFTPDTRCFFAEEDLALHWLYLYGIILLLLLVNLGFFIHLAYTLLSNQMEQKKHLKNSSIGGLSGKKTNEDLENFRLYAKLFVIMGLPWVIEVFTSFASNETLCYIWFLDLPNILRGVFIFIIFVCKKSTKDKIVKSWFPSKSSSPGSSQPSRKTSTMSLTSWLPSIHGRKISKVSMTSGGHINLEALQEEANEIKKTREEQV